MSILTFSVIIPTLNESGNIGSLLTSIQKQSIQPKEIVVVDGGSRDSTREIVKKYSQIRLINSSANIAKQRNVGVKYTHSQILFFLDADTQLPENFFRSALKYFNLQPDNTVICPYYLPYQSNPIIFSIYLFFNLMFFLFQKISASGAGSCVIVNKKFFTQLEGFREDIKFEDIEFIRRASRIGHFSIAPIYIWVSDRRFRKYGVIKTTFHYLILSVLFFFNCFNWSPFPYTFGGYSKKSS